MKITAMIKQLHIILEKDGDLDIEITGAYASSTNNIYEISSGVEPLLTGTIDKTCFIITDLMSG
jgi:hypothetical protein